MPDHPLTKLASGAALYAQKTEPTETPAPAPDGDGGIWYPTIDVVIGGSAGWSQSLSGNADGGIAYDGSYLYVTQDGFAIEKIDVSDGSQVWEYNPSYAGDTYGYKFDTDSDNLYFGTYDKTVSVSKSDGTENWANNSGVNCDGLKVDDSSVYILSRNENVRRLDKSDGSETWSVNTGADFALIEDQNHVYVGESNGAGIIKYNKSDGSEDWTSDGGDMQFEARLGQNSNYVFYNDATNSEFVAIDKSDGSIAWSVSVGNRVRSEIVTDSDNVFFAVDGGNLYSVQQSDGSTNWTYAANFIAPAGVHQDDDLVYSVTESDTIVAVDKSDGTLIYEYSMAGPSESDIVGDGSSIYYGQQSNARQLVNDTQPEYQTPARISNGSEWVVKNE